jgi:DNA-binding SARP family transcriptional activator
MSTEVLVEFRILGPVEVLAEGQPLDIGHAKQRSVLAVLLLDLGRVVPAERLIDRVWGEDPPRSVRNLLYGYITRLRAALASATDQDIALTRQAGGYQLDVSPQQVDLYVFRHQVASTHATPGEDERAVQLSGAIRLWRGAALTGLDSPWLRAVRQTLELERMAAVLDLNDLALRQGRHAALMSELTEQALIYPADERIAGQLMLALYRSGRQAEALRWFDQTRRRLIDEFGTDPGAELIRLHQQILRGDRALTVSSPSQATGPVPRELPADIAAFTGRSAELAELDRLLADATVTVLSGTAGVGKTALAVHWAHRIASQFPAGQLYLDLRGYDPAAPVSPADALAALLRSLGLPGADLPAELAERAARYRSLIAGRRVLVLLDNARDADQARHLLPGTPGCAALVTSRDSLAGLVARDGAKRLQLDPLPIADAIALLRKLVGDRVDADPAAAAMLADQASRLPLSLRVAAELAAARPDDSLSYLAAELAGQPGRLDLLDAGGDPRTAVRAVFSWSYQHLNAPAARAFALISAHPGTDWQRFGVAALTGTSPRHAQQLLDQLARAHLIHSAGQGRYGMHDLLKAYAHELAERELTEAELRTARAALFDHYRHATSVAIGALYPAGKHLRPEVAPASSELPPLADQAAARQWLDAERATLVAIVAQAADHEWLDHAAAIASTLFRELEGGGHYLELLSIYDHIISSAKRAGADAIQAEALSNICVVYLRQGNYAAARPRLVESLRLSEQRGDLTGQARALGNLGILDYLQGRWQQALERQAEAIERYSQLGDQLGENRSLTNLSLIELRQGQYAKAAQHAATALAGARRLGAQTTIANALISLGRTRAAQGRFRIAATCLRQAAQLYADRGDPTGQADALAGLGELAQYQGDCQRAADHYLRVAELSRQTGNKSSEAGALNGLGDSQLGRNQPSHALIEYSAALTLASEIGDSYEQARAHHGLSRAHLAQGAIDQADLHWREALTRYTELGAVEATQPRGGPAPDWSAASAGRPH